MFEKTRALLLEGVQSIRQDRVAGPDERLELDKEYTLALIELEQAEQELTKK